MEESCERETDQTSNDPRERWRIEAFGVIDDVKTGVKFIGISEEIPISEASVHFNVTTLEDQEFCIEMSAAGFCIVGEKHDVKDSVGGHTFETPYALLHKVSTRYTEIFYEELNHKLTEAARTKPGSSGQLDPPTLLRHSIKSESHLQFYQ